MHTAEPAMAAQRTNANRSIFIRLYTYSSRCCRSTFILLLCFVAFVFVARVSFLVSVAAWLPFSHWRRTWPSHFTCLKWFTIGIINLLLLRFVRLFASPATSSAGVCVSVDVGPFSVGRSHVLMQHIAFYLAAKFSLQLARTCFYCCRYSSDARSEVKSNRGHCQRRRR